MIRIIPGERFKSYTRMEEGSEALCPFELCDEFGLLLTGCFSVERRIVVKAPPATTLNAQIELKKHAECRGGVSVRQ